MPRVFRRGGTLSPSHRHGSYVRNVGLHGSRASQVVARRVRSLFPRPTVADKLLKKKHLRRLLIDQRILPPKKKEKKRDPWAWDPSRPKRKKLMDREEARH